jgi:hypothetical protein
MNIIIKNDGKGKAQSFTAELDLTSISSYWGYYNSSFIGYGSNEWSAKMSLIQQIDNLILELDKIKKSNA